MQPFYNGVMFRDFIYFKIWAIKSGYEIDFISKWESTRCRFAQYVKRQHAIRVTIYWTADYLGSSYRIFKSTDVWTKYVLHHGAHPLLDYHYVENIREGSP